MNIYLERSACICRRQAKLTSQDCKKHHCSQQLNNHGWCNRNIYSCTEHTAAIPKSLYLSRSSLEGSGGVRAQAVAKRSVIWLVLTWTSCFSTLLCPIILSSILSQICFLMLPFCENCLKATPWEAGAFIELCLCYIVKNSRTIMTRTLTQETTRRAYVLHVTLVLRLHRCQKEICHLGWLYVCSFWRETYSIKLFADLGVTPNNEVLLLESYT